MAKPKRNLRLFVAIHPPQDIVASWFEALRIQKIPAHRCTPSSQVHLTLQFIGDTPSKQVNQIIESVRCAGKGQGSFELESIGMIGLPERGKKRLVAVETNRPPALLELKRRLVSSLAQSPRLSPDDRFRPHFTLCRFREPSPLDRLQGTMLASPFRVDRFSLMRSELHSGGAEHSEVETIELLNL
ncbi:MAG: RNA 2',3'-cyclic phosphodiesterase [Planctomycetota bacterium]|nr:RNA 2',3'-cyclic phosphodiesterase [Planctomycetota bacterium]